jgi:hypothetical protein
MANVRIVLNRKGVRDILRSPGVLADLRRRAERIAAAAGPGHEVDSEVGRNRARESVRTDTIDAMVNEATSRTLSRALDAGRD